MFIQTLNSFVFISSLKYMLQFLLFYFKPVTMDTMELDVRENVATVLATIHVIIRTAYARTDVDLVTREICAELVGRLIHKTMSTEENVSALFNET